MGQLVHSEELLQEKGRIEREYAIEISSLKSALEEEEIRASLEDRLESIEESHDELVAKLINERDHAISKAKKLKSEKVEFGAARARLSEKLEKLDIAHKALESEYSILNESHDKLQTRLTKYDIS